MIRAAECSGFGEISSMKSEACYQARVNICWPDSKSTVKKAIRVYHIITEPSRLLRERP